MAAIRDSSTGHTRILESECLVGRAGSSTLCLDKKYVSSQHAGVRFTGERWEIRDLGSRNGTFLDGRRLESGQGYALCPGYRLAFGKLDEEWEFVDDSPPRTMAVPLDGGDAIEIEGELLAVPSTDNPRATIYRAADGRWFLEQPDSVIPVSNAQKFEVDGRQFRFSCRESAMTTSLANASAEVELHSLTLAFSVSRDEEYVELKATNGIKTFDLGARSHHYLLLTLARRRLADAAEALPHTSCGWLNPDDFPHDPGMTPARVNLDVLRIRKQVEALGIINAVSIIERRTRTRQLRIGLDAITVVTI